MARRKLMLFFSILFALVMVTGIGPASAKKVLLKMQLIFPSGSPWGGSGYINLADMVKDSSGGDIIFKPYEPGKLVAPSGALDSVSGNRIEAVGGQAAMWAGKMPAAPLFTSIPFGPEAPEPATSDRHGGPVGGAPARPEAVRPGGRGCRPLGWSGSSG